MNNTLSYNARVTRAQAGVQKFPCAPRTKWPERMNPAYFYKSSNFGITQHSQQCVN